MTAAAAAIQAQSPAQPAALSEGAKIFAFAVMCLGFFIALLDIQIVSASLHDIGGGLSAGADETAWVQTSYLIAEIIVIPLSGWLSRVMSTRWLFCVSAAGFTATSLLCGWAWDIQSMIVFRALQGFLGGSMIPTVFTTAFVFFPGRKIVVAAATIGAISSLAPTLGPTIGGWITDNYSWHWLFFVNLVPGIFVAVVVPMLVRIDKPNFSLLRGADYIGMILMALFLGCFEYALEEGPRWDWFGDDTIRATAWISGIAGVAFVWRSLTFAHPVVDLRALKSRNFALGCFFSFITGIGIFATIYLTPLFLGRVRGFSALQIGLAVFSTGIFQVCAIPVYVFCARRVDLRWLLMFGLVCFALSMWNFSPITHDWGWQRAIAAASAAGFCPAIRRGAHRDADAWRPRAGPAEAGVRPVQPDAQSRRRDRHRRLRNDLERPHQPALPAARRAPQHHEPGDDGTDAPNQHGHDPRRRRAWPSRRTRIALVADDAGGADPDLRRRLSGHHGLLRRRRRHGPVDAEDRAAQRSRRGRPLGPARRGQRLRVGERRRYAARADAESPSPVKQARDAMPDAALLSKLEAAVQANWDRQVAWLQSLVGFPSKRGKEGPCQDWIAREFAGRGWSVDRYTLADVSMDHLPGFAPVMDTDYKDAVQVVATVRAPEQTGRSLILQGHVDVVPEGPGEMWTFPPFSPVIRDDWMNGRGVGDMKQGVSAMVFAMDALRTAGLAPAADVYVQTVTEEECTGNGALSTLARGYRAEACLIPEPTGNALTRSHVGVMWFRLRVRGVPVHVGQAQTGSNAIMSAFALIQAIQALTDTINTRALSHPHFKDVPSPIKFNPGVIRGGDWGSSTPAWCEVDCRIGCCPARRWRRPGRRSRHRGEGGAGGCVYEQQSARSHLERFPGGRLFPRARHRRGGGPGGGASERLRRAMAERLSTAVNDTRFYGLYYGIPGSATALSAMASHGFDERANLPRLKQTTLAIAAFIADWCGTRPV
ncbi:MAG: ArgE/DapE family deacylase [Acetobacteraceae bacterium]